MTIEPLTFSCAEGFKVRLAPEAIATVIDSGANAGCSETGGILIGHYDEEGWTAMVTQATPKPRDSSVSWFWFKRGNKGLKALLEQRWAEGLHYLGEWHFHPRGAPEPSKRDLASMERSAENPTYHCSEPVLIILGGYPPEKWTISATICHRTHGPIRLTLA